MRSALFGVATLVFCITNARAQEDKPTVKSLSPALEILRPTTPMPASAIKSGENALPERPHRKAQEKPCDGANPNCQKAPAQHQQIPANSFTRPPRVSDDRTADKKFWLMSGLTAGSALVTWRAGRVCRSRNGVEPCFQGYGEFNAMEGIRLGGSAIVVPVLTHWWKEDHPKSWWAIPLSMIGFNLWQASEQLRIHKKKVG